MNNDSNISSIQRDSDSSILFIFTQPIGFVPRNPPVLLAGQFAIAHVLTPTTKIFDVAANQSDDIGAIWTAEYGVTLAAGDYVLFDTVNMQSLPGGVRGGGVFTLPA